jgi:GAF domain-containing protein
LAGTSGADSGASDDTIAWQAGEIERLQGEIERLQRADELLQALSAVAATAALMAPALHTELLELILRTAARVTSAAAGTLFAVDRQTHELVFEVGLGVESSRGRDQRVAPGEGIAGMVAATGQPFAIADAEEGSQHASDIAARVGFTPRAVLAVPMLSGHTVTGVLELLDKAGGQPFSHEDMALLSLFAQQASVAIRQSRAQRSLEIMLDAILGSISPVGGHDGPGPREAVLAAVRQIEAEDPAFERSFELATLVQEIASIGQEEAALCRSILKRVAGYIHGRRSLAHGVPRLSHHTGDPP